MSSKKPTGKIELFTNVFLILGLGSSVSLLFTIYLNRLPNNIQVGTVVNRDLYADQNYSIIDEKKTQQLKEEAAQKIRPVYDLDPSIEQEALNTVHQAFATARALLVETPVSEDGLALLGEGDENFSKQQYLQFRSHQFSPDIENLLITMIRSGMRGYIVASMEELTSIIEKGFVLRSITQTGVQEENELYTLDSFISLDLAKKRMNQFTIKELEWLSPETKMDKDLAVALNQSASLFIRLNVTFNNIETETRRRSAMANVPVVKYEYERGQSIILRGDRVEPRHITVIDGINRIRLQSNSTLKFLGVFLFVNLVLLIVYYYSARYLRKFHPTRNDLIFLGSIMLFCLILLRVGVFLSATIRDALPFQVDLMTLNYAIPVVAGAMLVRFVLNSGTALVFAVVFSLFAGIFLENNLQITIYYLVSGVFAAHAIAHVDRRSTVLLSGFYTGMVNALLVLSLNLITIISISESVEPSVILYNCLFAFLGGISAAMTVLILTPVCETLFNYTTDIKLLEMANLSHPLLKQLIVRAPGTYHHSQLVGILAEAAAETIGANALLARVASYYHDVGKMKQPQYFIENQRSGENPHDKLTPAMSSNIITAHVDDGIAMAKKYKLPQRIADMIPQHQGTKLVGYFYNKAKQNLAGDEAMNERDYRYPGPKPQTREGGIIMLADAVEACVRSMPEKTPQKMQAKVEDLVSQHFVDEQLDECDLTLKDLHQITEAFVKILIGIYHQRVEYPEGALLAQPLQAVNAGISEQPAPTPSNITSLFRKKR